MRTAIISLLIISLLIVSCAPKSKDIDSVDVNIDDSLEDTEDLTEEEAAR